MKNKTMKAVLHTGYGPPEELQLAEVEKPVPNDMEVLIRIRATTVTTTDCNVRNFTFVPRSLRFPARLYFGLNKPKTKILGIDFAGEVEATGKAVTRFRAGDEVFGSPGARFGAHAEYICMPENGALALKPAGISFEEAAAMPLAGNTALFFIRDLGKVQAGQKILIHGASGGIGTFALQLAKYYGATVTAVCSGANAEMVRSLGADRVIDYTREDYTCSDQRYDIVFGVVGKTTFNACKNLLKPKGVYLENVLELKDMLKMMGLSMMGGKKIKGAVAIENTENMNFLKELAESGRVRPVVDRTFTLEEIAKAFRYVEQGHKKGNVVITFG